jgi:hypothetical protein
MGNYNHVCGFIYFFFFFFLEPTTPKSNRLSRLPSNEKTPENQRLIAKEPLAPKRSVNPLRVFAQNNYDLENKSPLSKYIIEDDINFKIYRDKGLFKMFY